MRFVTFAIIVVSTRVICIRICTSITSCIVAVQRVHLVQVAGIERVMGVYTELFEVPPSKLARS